MMFVAPDSFPFSQSILFLLAVIVGGAGWVLGPGGRRRRQRRAAGTAVAARRVPAAVLRRPAAGRAVARAGGHHRHARALSAPRPIRAAPPTAQASISPRSCRRRRARTRSTVDGIGIAFGGIRAATDVSFAAEPGAHHQRDRPERRRQDHGAQHDRRLLPRRDPAASASATRELAGAPAWKIARAGIARTYQTTQLFGTMSVLDNVLVALRRGRLGASAGGARTPDDDRGRRGAARLRRLPRPARRRRPATCRMSTAAWSRSPARSRRARRCCCSTSPPPA